MTLWDYSEVEDYSEGQPYVLAAPIFQPRRAQEGAPANFDWAEQEQSFLTQDLAPVGMTDQAQDTIRKAVGPVLAVAVGAAMITAATGCDRMTLGNRESGTANAWVCEPGYVAEPDHSLAGWRCVKHDTSYGLACPDGWVVGRNSLGAWGCRQARHK